MKIVPRETLTLVIGAVFGIWLWNYGLDINGERKHAIFAIRRDLEIGMDYDAVLAVIEKHRAPFVDTQFRDEAVFVCVRLSLADTCQLSVIFKDRRLSSARIRGEDGPHETFPDGPPDIPAQGEQPGEDQPAGEGSTGRN